jgi:parvulin-like peptidyl-prolyl isomerase
LDPTFEEKAFELETSTLANPKYVEVKTGFGYHIIMVEGRKWFYVKGRVEERLWMGKVGESGAAFSYIHNTLVCL